MLYEWDEQKCVDNVSKHGLHFADAEQVFEGQTVTFEDTRSDYGEPRFITFGLLVTRLVVIAHTPRSDKTRIISMRKGNEREQKYYEKRLKTT